MHGFTSSASQHFGKLLFTLHKHNSESKPNLDYSPWRYFGLDNNFILIWPDGSHDSPNSLGSWNMSQSFGPEGLICDLNRQNWNSPVECYDSCPLCDEMYSCDWTSCYDDLGFVRTLIDMIKQDWCIDEAQIHMSGYSNGGMFSYYVATHAQDSLGNEVLLFPKCLQSIQNLKSIFESIFQ